MAENLREKLNRIDLKCIDEESKFYDLRSLFEAVAPKLTPEDKEEVKKVIQNTDDAETIAAVLMAKAGDKNESLEEEADSFQARIFDFLDELGGYADYNQRIEEVSDEFGMSPDEAEGYVWDWTLNSEAEWYDTADQEEDESLQEKLVDAPQEVVDKLLEILEKHGFILDNSFKENPIKTFMGNIHIQVINPNSSFEVDDEDWFDAVTSDRNLMNDIHNLENEYNCPITWNFGPNNKGQVTGGLDIMKQYIPDETDESLNEASYGGAYDIEDDMYFTRDDLMEFGYDLAEQFSAWADDKCELSDVYMTSPVDLVMEVSESDGAEHQAKVKIDMRKIRLPRDIEKYTDTILKQWKDSYNEYHSYDESLDNIPYTYEQMEQELKSATHNWTEDNFEGWVGYKDEFDSAMQILSHHYENVDNLGHTYRGYGFFATRPSLFEDTVKQNGKWVNKGKEGLQEKIITNSDLKAARFIIKTSINPKEIAAAQKLIAEYNKQQEEIKNESLTKQQENSPKRYVYEICDKLGWNPPMFIDAVAGGYRLRYKEDSKEEAQETIDMVKQAASELGIKVKKALVKPTNQRSPNDDWVDYDGPTKDNYIYPPNSDPVFVNTSPDWDSKEYKKWVNDNYHWTYYAYMVIPRYEPEEAIESLNEDLIISPEKEYQSKSGHRILIKEVIPYMSEYDGTANLRIKYDYQLAGSNEWGSSECNQYDLFKMLNEDWNIEDQIDAPETIGKLNPGDKFKNRNGVEITIAEPQKDGTIQYKIGDEVRAGSERSIQRMLYKNNYLREDYNSFLTLADNDANKLRNEYDKGDKSIFDILTSLNYIQDDPDSVYMYKEVSDGYAIVFDLSSYDEGKNYVKYFVVDENNNIPKGYTITKLLIEDYQHDKDEWGDPYSYDEVERELKNITNDWTDKEGTIRCYWEQEKNYGMQILQKHYDIVEPSDGRTGSGEEMSWVLAYAKPKAPLNEGWTRDDYLRLEHDGYVDIDRVEDYIWAKYDGDIDDKKACARSLMNTEIYQDEGKVGTDVINEFAGAHDLIYRQDFDEMLNESKSSYLKDKIIDCLDWFILMEMDFPKDKFLADSWEDVKDGIQMGIDPQFEVAEGIIEYLKPIITFNKKYNKEVGEEGVFQDEIEMYQSLVRAMNNYLAKNGYEDRIEEDFSFEDNVDQMKDLMGQNSNLFSKIIDDVETPKKDNRIFKFLKRKEK